MALNIIFMGTPEFAVPALECLHKSNHNILEVYTQPPKKKNRGQKLNFSPVYQYCDDKKIKVKYPKNLDNDEVYNHIKKLNPDLIVVVAYGKILPKRILEIKKGKFLNIHASLLPKWRGAAPIHRAIMNLDKETGISIMQIVPKLDAGPVLMKSKVKISRETNYQDLSEKLSKLGSEMLLKSLKLIENEKANFTPQNDKEATYAKKISKEEARVNWKQSADRVVAKINALNPNPGSWINYSGSRIKIIKAKEVTGGGSEGEIINKNFTVACKKNAIQILELQKEGKKKMNTEEYLKGNHFKIGEIIN